MTAIILYLQYFENSETLKSCKMIMPLISEMHSSLGCNTAAVSAEQQRKATRARQLGGSAPRRSPPAPSIPMLPPHTREPLWCQQGRTKALPPPQPHPFPEVATPSFHLSVGSNGGRVCCSLSPAFLRTRISLGSCSYMDYQPRRHLSGHSLL